MALGLSVDNASVTILATESLSGNIPLEGYTEMGLIMPAAWTAAAITFQVSVDGSTWVDFYGTDNTEKSLTVGASRAYTVEGLAPFRFVRLRSGVTATPVAQAADRVINIALKG